MSQEGQELHVAMRKTRLTNPLVLPSSPFLSINPILQAMIDLAKEPYFTCPSCGSHYYGRDTAESDGQVITLKTVRCHGGWSSSDPQVTVCHWRGEWPKKGPGQPKKGNVRFTAHITPSTHKQILSQQKPGMTLGQVIDSAFKTEPTNKV